jgi:hypothetical protein
LVHGKKKLNFKREGKKKREKKMGKVGGFRVEGGSRLPLLPCNSNRSRGCGQEEYKEQGKARTREGQRGRQGDQGTRGRGRKR